MEELAKNPDYRQLCNSLTLQSQKEGFFNDFLASVKEEMDQVQWAECIDSAAKLSYVWGLSNARKLSLCSMFKAKDVNEAVQKRLQGNEAFEKKQFAKALLLYSQSVIFAPAPSSVKEEKPALALALANRSATLLHLKEWQLCLQDTQYALQSGYPENQRYKLYDRMAQCYHQLNESQKSDTAYKIFLGCLDKAESLTKEKMEQLKADLQNKLEKPAKATSKDMVPPKPALCKPGNVTFANASKSFDISVSTDMGRYAVAKEEIKPGETVLVESPFAACLLPDKFGSHCHHCFQRIKVAYACNNCRSVAFCGLQCLEQAQSYHAIECPILDVLIGSGISILSWLAMRILTRQSVKNFTNLRGDFHPQEDAVRLNEDGVYEADKYETFYNLCTLESSRASSDMFDRTVMAVFLLKCLQAGNYLKTVSNTEALRGEELWIAQLLLRNLHIVQFNAHEILEQIQPEVNNVRKFQPVCLGAGIYNTVAFCNHSCYPAVSRYFHGTTLVLTSTRTIAPREMIAENYGPMFMSMGKRQRQNYLKGRYWFDCCCQACKEDWPVYDQLTSRPQFTCPSGNCKQKLVIHPSQNAICMSCKKAYPVASLLKTLETVEAIYCQGMDSLGKGYVEDAIKPLMTFIEKAENLTTPPYRELHLAQDALRHCLTTRGTTYYPTLDKFKP